MNPTPKPSEEFALIVHFDKDGKPFRAYTPEEVRKWPQEMKDKIVAYADPDPTVR
jgi:hypothetical protein